MALSEIWILSKYFSKVQKVVHLFLWNANDNSYQFDPSNLSCKLIFRTEELNWIYSTFTQLPYTISKVYVSNKTAVEEEQGFPSMICPRQQGLQALGISWLKTTSCALILLQQLAPMKQEKQEVCNRRGLRDTRFVKQGCSRAATYERVRSKGRWTHLDGKETW